MDRVFDLNHDIVEAINDYSDDIKCDPAQRILRLSIIILFVYSFIFLLFYFFIFFIDNLCYTNFRFNI